MKTSYLTVRNIPEQLAAALEREKQRRGKSLNQTIIDLLSQSLGLDSTRRNGVRRFAGTWTEAEHQEFLSAMPIFEENHPEF